jgi:hypothetical protein
MGATTMTSTSARDLSQTGPLSTRNKVGLALCGLLGTADIVGLAFIGAAEPGVQGPPTAVIVSSAVMGVITLVALVFTWRSGSRLGSRIIAATRILSALTGVPAFLLDNVPPLGIVIAGGGIVITLVAVWLLLSRPTSP